MPAPAALLLLLCCFALVACPSDDGSVPTDAGDVVVEDAGPPPAPEPPSACGDTYPGPTPVNAQEFQPGYEDAVAELDLQAHPPPYDLSGEGGLQAGLVNYMLGRYGGRTVTEDDLVAAGGMGDAIRAAYASGEGSLDFLFLRWGFHHHYYCEVAVPADLDDFVARYGDFTAWPMNETPCGAPKDTPRRMWEDPEGRAVVAETMVDGEVRETEILFFDLRDDGQIDFGAYTEDGFLMDRSEFATASSSVVIASPYACMTCHTQSGLFSNTFDNRHPTGTGAGCR